MWKVKVFQDGLEPFLLVWILSIMISGLVAHPIGFGVPLLVAIISVVELK